MSEKKRIALWIALTGLVLALTLPWSLVSTAGGAAGQVMHVANARNAVRQAVAAADGDECPFVGTWVGASTDGVRFTETVVPVPGDEDRVTLNLTAIFDVTLMGQYPLAHTLSAGRGEAKRAASNTWTYTLISYASDSNGQLVYIAVASG